MLMTNVREEEISTFVSMLWRHKKHWRPELLGLRGPGAIPGLIHSWLGNDQLQIVIEKNGAEHLMQLNVHGDGLPPLGGHGQKRKLDQGQSLRDGVIVTRSASLWCE